MCNQGCLSRAPTIDSGALMAAIHPLPPASTSTSTFPLFAGATLHLSNPATPSSPTQSSLVLLPSRAPSPAWSTCSTSSTTTTTTSSSSPSSALEADKRGLTIRIHEFSEASPVMHAFACAADGGACILTAEPARRRHHHHRLNLGVGGDGVVGRTVSVLDAEEAVVLGVGVVGWG